MAGSAQLAAVRSQLAVVFGSQLRFSSFEVFSWQLSIKLDAVVSTGQLLALKYKLLALNCQLQLLSCQLLAISH